MLYIHPIIRLFGALLIVVSIFLTKSLVGLALVYTLVVSLVLLSRVALNHIRFVVFVTMPLLIALLILWGWLIDSHRVALSNANGKEYAVYLWLRIVSWGGVLQFLFVPLVEKPSHLKNFLHRVGLSGSLGTLIIASLVFLPEMHRRLSQIMDARRAQGNPFRGLKGLRDIPTLLMPLISSLLDSAAKRAEFWSHRGILETGRATVRENSYSGLQSAFLFVLSISSCIIAVLS